MIFPLTTHCAVISENGLLCGHEKLHFLHPPFWNGAVTVQELLDLVLLHLWEGNLGKCSKLLSTILLQQRGTHRGGPCRSCGIDFMQTFVRAASCASKTSSGCGCKMTYYWTTNFGVDSFWNPLEELNLSKLCCPNASSRLHLPEVPHCLSRRSEGAHWQWQNQKISAGSLDPGW